MSLARYIGDVPRTYLYLETGDEGAVTTAPHSVSKGDVVDFGAAGVVPDDAGWEPITKAAKGDTVVLADNAPAVVVEESPVVPDPVVVPDPTVVPDQPVV